MNIGYYVTMIRDPGPRQKVAWLLGPFGTKEAAEGAVKTGKTLAEEVDPRCFWDAFGVTKLTRQPELKLPPGKLNARADELEYMKDAA